MNFFVFIFIFLFWEYEYIKKIYDFVCVFWVGLWNSFKYVKFSINDYRNFFYGCEFIVVVVLLFN